MQHHFERLKQHLSDNCYTWLITGCAGFIGSHLLEALLQLNQKVVGIDDMSTGYYQNITQALNKVGDKKHNFTFHEGDIRSIEACRKATYKVDYVLHQAALGSVSASLVNPLLTNEINVTGFLTLFTASKEADVKTFVYASSCAVYGDSLHLPQREKQPKNPLSPYAASKYINELYAKTLAQPYGIKTIGLRYFNVFGPRQNTNGSYAAVIPQWITCLLRGKPVNINGDGCTSRDFCYVADIVQANLLAAATTNDQAFNKVYNIASGRNISLNELLKRIRLNINPATNVEIIYQDFRPGDIRHSFADISQAGIYLHYSPQYSLDTGLSLTVPWYINHINCSL